ncbi:MAG TPA: CopG family transcriptional regulator [Sphingopyxis sp.]|uniref:CopG family transcriptional regulator n=1 Tax=Sphingopyxis sp. TaxID=1908224 RepID=UPI002BAE7D46|nr:CopG family transcriptional regulator [Sphingopyxis sp.]HWT42085.1 CopG family transcriptional regulator [Sphingopyxis sp.]HWW58143.1 CopG family transcriptional regulator [Sphingopyxis sp.]
MGRRKENKVRYQLFLPLELSQRFEALAAAPGAAKSAILVDALTAWLNRQAVSELENRFSARLDRMSLALGRVERDGHILLESFALFIRYQLMVQAPLAEGDEAARAVGRERFNAFVTRVGEAMASGTRTLGNTPDQEKGR